MNNTIFEYEAFRFYDVLVPGKLQQTEARLFVLMPQYHDIIGYLM